MHRNPNPQTYNALISSSLKKMHRDLTPHTWMHRNRHSSHKCTGILPLTHEYNEIIITQVNKCTGILPLTHPESYPSHMNAPKSSSTRYMHRNLTPHTWMHRNHHPSSKCTGILPLTHESTQIVTPQVNGPESYPSNMKAPKLSSLM